MPDRTIATRQNAPFAEPAAPAQYAINLVCINPFELPAAALEKGPDFFRGRYTIGMWWWELEHVPEAMARAEDYVDEVWVGSEHTAAALRRSLTKQVFVFPPPIMPPSPLPLGRSELELPDGFIFLCLYDFNSTIERKNPLDLIDAFRMAFDVEDEARLVLKSVNGHLWPDKLEQVRAAARGRADILVRDGFLDSGHVQALIANCDSYASLHRAEGFGLPLAEAMALGKPVTATRYGGNLEFMTDENSYLLPWSYTQVPEGAGQYPSGARWAQPDVEAAAKALRHIFDDRIDAAAKAAQAYADVRNGHSPEARGAAIRSRLIAINRAQKSRRSAPTTFLRAQIKSVRNLGFVREAEAAAGGGRGGIRSRVRRILYQLLYPLFNRQENYNQESAKVLAELLEIAQDQELAIRRLEAELAELRRPEHEEQNE
jgi:glycosyltransferase involved in cell wall biosynthesis